VRLPESCRGKLSRREKLKACAVQPVWSGRLAQSLPAGPTPAASLPFQVSVSSRDIAASSASVVPPAAC
jgi:hypothetical protein